uniref:carboxylesterase n=1 Tax=Anopheles coluzzii TaxID=1518534 RepID=A0A6E8W2V0_ANOCL
MGRLQYSFAALLSVLTIASIIGTSLSQDYQGPVVDIQGLGSVLGTMGETAWTGRPIYQFFNIKYAEAPVGEQRFRAPLSVLPWSGVMNVTAPGRGCPQRRTISQDDPDAEDCLTLSSGTLFMPWVICQDPTEGAYEIARIIGCPMTTPAEIDNCLKSASVSDLVLAQDEHKKNEFSSPGYPKVAGACITVGGALGDESFMPVHPRESTYFRDVEIIFGMNSQEGLIFFNEYFQYALDSQPIEFDFQGDF